MSEVKTSGSRLFSGDFSGNARLAEAVTRVREILLEAGTDGIKHGQLYKRIWYKLDTTELHTLMSVLHECGMVQKFKVGRGMMYRATKTIEKFGVTSEVLSKLNVGS